MDPAQIFADREGTLRAGWRLLLFVLFLAVGLIIFQATAIGFIRHSTSQIVHLLFSTLAFLSAVLLATWVMMFLVEHQPFVNVGFSIGPSSLREACLGCAGGAALIGAVVFVEWATGSIHMQATGESLSEGLTVAIRATGIFLVGATTEELLFRGYAFQRIIEGTNGAFAVAISSAVFGLLHRANPHASILSVFNTMLAGALLSISYLKTRALWLPIGFHFSWNWSLALAGLPISGLDLGSMPWRAVPADTPQWVNGGAYGPEGGVVATIALSGGIAFLLLLKSSPAHPQTGPTPVRQPMDSSHL